MNKLSDVIEYNRVKETLINSFARLSEEFRP